MGGMTRRVVGLVVFAFLAGCQAFAKEGSPLAKGGNFGLGLVVGEPGDWGVSGKLWLNRVSAVQPAISIDKDVVIQCDYLWHKYGAIHPSEGIMPLYLGVGGATDFEDAFGVRGVFGLTYLFPRTPLDIFVELTPTLWFFNGGDDFKFDGGLGSRYYF